MVNLLQTVYILGINSSLEEAREWGGGGAAVEFCFCTLAEELKLYDIRTDK